MLARVHRQVLTFLKISSVENADSSMASDASASLIDDEWRQVYR